MSRLTSDSGHLRWRFTEKRSENNVIKERDDTTTPTEDKTRRTEHREERG